MREPDPLFSSRDLRQALDYHKQQLLDEINGLDPDELLATPPEDLIERFSQAYRIHIPVLHYHKIQVGEQEAQVDVSGHPGRAIFDRSQPFYLTGTEVSFFIPFEGDADLFKCTASSRSLNPPVGEVRESEFVLRYTRLDHDADAVTSEFDREVEKIKQGLAWIAADVRPLNESLESDIRTAIDQRRDKLLADRKLVASLGYQLRVREDAPQTYAVPTVRRKPSIRPKPAGTKPFEPEPELSMEEYEHILDILASMVSVIEKSPGAFKTMKEEDLRWHFLVQLNGHYEGQATGETFNFEGKTDILIREKDRNIFIAECKFWKGPKSLTAAVDQLLGYATWRDTKIAILLFNRTKNLSTVLQQIPSFMEGHSNHKRTLDVPGATRFRFVFTHRDDPNRELIITLVVFEVPQ